MADDPVEALGELEAGGYLILAFLVIGVLAFVGYEVYQLGGSIGDGFSNLWDQISGAASKAGASVSSGVSGIGTYIPGTTGNANVNTPPPIPTLGVPPGYNWQTGQIDGSPGGAGGSW